MKRGPGVKLRAEPRYQKSCSQNGWGCVEKICFWGGKLGTEAREVSGEGSVRGAKKPGLCSRSLQCWQPVARICCDMLIGSSAICVRFLWGPTTYLSTSASLIKAKQCKSSSRKSGDRNRSREHREGLSLSFFSTAWSACFLVYVRFTCPGLAPLTVGLLSQTEIKKTPQWASLPPSLIEGSQLKFFLLLVTDFSLGLVGKG